MQVNKQRRGLRTKKRISDIAIDLFARKGYHSVTVDEIVEKSDTSKGAFYSHFDSKAHILYEEFSKADIYYLQIFENLPDHLSAEDKLITFVRKMMQYIEKLGKEMITVVYSSAITHNPGYFVKDDRKLYFIIHSIISEGIEKKEFLQDLELHETTRHISRGLRGSLYDWCLHKDDKFDLIKESENMIHTLINGIKIK